MNPININKIDTNREFLVVNEKFKTLFFKFEKDKGLPNHSHNGYATIQVLDGIIDIEFVGGEKFELREGDFLPFDARVEHNVIARVTSKVLVTISL
ncbi:cupin domain-containing protein [Romboutsia sp. 1001713B170207_170306_H8]|uniref:cupin domain-containing protein n=1 Tax=Romboutsia sp. 1001713B170207_170306_H8 TaxID=2787112 RepID=UPI000822BF2E|nr:cupin domain-containing protein [Romboutsia sp. 1001713B170207_170306_H8]SCH71088.1 Cupin domain [uncultured Clostridium sp.]